MSGYQKLPQLGFGLGLRPEHYAHIFEHRPNVDWFEIISENYMDTDGRPKRNLAKIKERYPIVMHGVSMSIGTTDPINKEYLSKLKALADCAKPAWISDHLCFTGVAHRNTHDLLPLPYTEEALRHVVERIKMVQDYLERPIALENPSTYLEFQSSTIPEAEFIAAMAKESGCNLLLDVNNVYVTCFNHRLDPKAYIDTLPLDRVIQIHLAGHDNQGTHIVDTHDGPVIEDVWAFYKYVVAKAGRIPNTIIEWDANIPDFPVVYAELEKARIAAADPCNHSTLVDFTSPEARLSYIKNNNIQEEQLRLQQAIVSGDVMSAYPESWIRPKSGFAPHDQLNVYINAYKYRLYDTVADDYPVLAHYMGQSRFRAAIEGFVAAAHSDHFNIGRYAIQLQSFLETSYPDDLFAHELCRLETALSQLADVEETDALQADAFVGLDADTLLKSSFSPRKALALLQFTYPVNRYYQEVKDGHSPSMPLPEASWLAVFRDQDVMWRMDMTGPEIMLLQEMTQGVTLQDALNRWQANNSFQDVAEAANITEWFSRWARHGILSSIHFSLAEPSTVAA